MRLVSLFALVLALATSGCDSGEPATCENTSTEVGKVDVVVGTGSATATVNSVVTVTYVGTLTDGTVFDSGRLDDYPLSETVQGFRIGVAGMKNGGRRTFTIPPLLGYGAVDRRDTAGNVVIPACSSLVFDLTLIESR